MQAPALPGPEVVVDIPLGGEPAAAALGAVMAALGGDFGELRVRLLVPVDHPERDLLAELCAADPRVSVEAPGPPPPARVRITLPPRARPGRRTLAALVSAVSGDGASAVVVPVPGRLGRSAGLVRAETGGDGGARRLRAREVDLGSTSHPLADPPPPQGSLGAERAEHLRYRARSATARSRVERGNQRLARERMRIQHEKARALLLERRIAACGPRYVIWFWLRRLARSARAAALKPVQLLKQARSLVRRLRRRAVDRVRRWRSPAPKVRRPGQEYLERPDL